MIHQATKQGQGGRSQPADYGQGGTATPRGKSVQPAGKKFKMLSENVRDKERKDSYKTRDKVVIHNMDQKAAQEAAKRREQNRSQNT